MRASSSRADVPNRAKALAQVNYQIKNYDKAIEFGNKAIKGGGADDDMFTLVAQAYYIKDDFKGTEKFVNEYVDEQDEGGQDAERADPAAPDELLREAGRPRTARRTRSRSSSPITPSPSTGRTCCTRCSSSRVRPRRACCTCTASPPRWTC